MDGLVSDTVGFSLNTIQLNNLMTAEAMELHIRSLNAFPLQGAVSIELLDAGLNVLQSIPTEFVMLSSLDGILDPFDNLYKASNKSVLLLDTELVKDLLDTKFIVIKKRKCKHQMKTNQHLCLFLVMHFCILSRF